MAQTDILRAIMDAEFGAQFMKEHDVSVLFISSMFTYYNSREREV